MSTVYLHVGMHKTGTSALQHFMGQNNEVLEKFHMHYPDLGITYNGIGEYRNGRFLVAPYIDERGREDKSRPSNEYDTALEKLGKLGKQYDRIILSEESIWWDIWKRKEHYTKVREDFNQRGLDVKIIVYLRRQDRWIESFWAQKVKEYDTRSFEKFVEDRGPTMPLDYYAWMERAADIFGRDALIIRVYEKEQYLGTEQTLYSDFLNIFGLTLQDGFALEKEIYNISLMGDSLEMKRVLNHLPEFHDSKNPLVRQVKMTQDISEKQEQQNYYFEPSQRIAFMEQFRESNQKLARDLERKDGILFYETWLNSPEPTFDDGELLRKVILVYGAKINQLEQELRELRKYTVFYRLKNLINKLIAVLF